MKYDINNPRPLPSQDKLKKLLGYNPATGELTWKACNRPDLVGMPVGGKLKGGYIACKIDGIKYAAHRIIYKIMTGDEPNVMDHINGVPNDNRWDNLQSVTPQGNNLNVKLLKNNKTGSAGVYYHPKQDRYHASIRINGKSHHLGSFKTKAEAVAARLGVNKILGFSERHGEAA